MQVRYIMKRYWDRMRGDIIVPLSTVAGNIAMALILSSVFYNLQPNSSSFYYRTSVMYYALLLMPIHQFWKFIICMKVELLFKTS